MFKPIYNPKYPPMYKSPIELIELDSVVESIKDETDNQIYQAIRRVGIDVDKEELIKALKYDRGQYDKGYADGYKEAISEFNAKIELYKTGICIRGGGETVEGEKVIVIPVCEYETIFEELAGDN